MRPASISLLCLLLAACDVSIPRLQDLGADLRRNDRGVVISADLDDAKIEDGDLKLLEGFGELQVLVLGPEITDAGLTHIVGLTALEQLDLTRTQVTEVGIDRLREALPACQIAH